MLITGLVPNSLTLIFCTNSRGTVFIFLNFFDKIVQLRASSFFCTKTKQTVSVIVEIS